MSRGRKRKSQKGTFSEENMQNAVRQVLLGEEGRKLSLREAASLNGVSFQTLQRYVKKQVNNPNPEVEIRMVANYKHRLVFNSEEEKSLANYMVQCSKMCYGKSTKDFRELAYEMAKINSKTMPPSWEIKQKAGIDWLQGFLKRHPELSIRQPEGCSISRATSFNKHNVKQFFNNIENAYSRSQKFSDGSRVYNLDETGTTTVQKPKKVIAAKGTKQVSQCTSGERGTLVTTCCIVSATGNSLPPIMVFPRKNFKTHMVNGAPPGTLGLVSSSGWMTGEIFPSVMRHFIAHTSSTKENPSLLIYDNHESHLTIETLNLAKENGVTIVTLPPHCSNKLQPLDVSVFYSFKAHYNSAVDSWLLHNPGVPLTIYQIASCVGIAHERAMNPSNIRSGFKKTGIYPFDRNIFTDDDFMTSSVTDRDLPGTSNGPVNIVSDEIQSTALQLPPQKVPSTSSKLFSANDSSEKIHQISPSSDSSRLNLDSSQKKPFIGPDSFKGFPKAGARKKQRNNQHKVSSCIPTDTPEKNRIENKTKEKLYGKRKLSLVRKELFNKKKKIINSEPLSSEDEDDYGPYLPCDSSDDETEWSPEIDPSGFEELDRKPECGDFVLVQFSAKRDIFYIGNVVATSVSGIDIEISFLRKCVKNEGKFVFPPVPDLASVPLEDIKMILPKPSFSGKTKRLQSFYKFEIDFRSLNIC